jgi:hypothetical protein
MAETKIKPEQALSTTRTKIIVATFDLTTSTGDVAYTGAGFRPTGIVALATVDAGANTVNIGVVDSAGTDGKVGRLANGNEYYASSLFDIETVSNNYHTAAFKQFDADGFTITWTKTNSPSGTARLVFLCFR